ncbi:hypothetical protein [Micromonospora sp. 4G55]|uniref:DUF7455 domain-containing protein n=1 Tax=Micromonospora sp. 4G55 TaxID=2806102 RepID=UPI001A55F344|nr:hypothetical protein [Micromonospora sp. 4G55]MBM0256378.1 hypothetical protein [Micromonospora sp. 4G55]
MPTPIAPPECDARCPATAMVIVIKGRDTLAFCGHHYADHEVALTVDGWQVYADSRAQLTKAA